MRQALLGVILPFAGALGLDRLRPSHARHAARESTDHDGMSGADTLSV
jgi:hypothetical protein